MAERVNPGEQARLLQQAESELMGWEQPQAHLREALAQDHLHLYGQPIVSLTGSRSMVEILVRMREEEALMLPPGEFLPAFAHYRMMAELDRWVACHAARAFRPGERYAAISVNASTQSIEEPGFADYAASQLLEAGLDPSALIFEIDEGDALDRPDAAARFAGEVRAVGCRLMLDGFAQRAVTFDPLKRLRVDFVKVDGSVIRKIRRSGSAAAKLKAIVRVGELAGIGVVAECVEEAAIVAALKKSGVGYAQGFGVGKPEPIEKLFER